MKNHIQTTVLLMNEELELLRSLKKILSNQKELIFNSNVEAFTENVRTEESLLEAIKNVEKERLNYMNRLRKIFQYDSQLTLTKLAGMLEEPYKTTVFDLKKQYLSLLGDIRKLNLENRFLVKKSLIFVQKNLSILKDFTKNDFVYSSQGGYGEINAPLKRVLDTSM